MGKYFKITPETAWGGTIYIHSHARSLKDSDNRTQCSNAIKELQDEIHLAAEKVSQNLTSTIEYFQLETDKIKRAGYPLTPEGKPAGMTQRYEQIKNELMDAYKILTTPGKVVERNKRVKNTSTEDEVKQLLSLLAANQAEVAIKTFLDAEQEKGNIGKIISTRLLQMLKNKKYKQRAEKVQIDINKETEELTVEEVVKILKKRNKKEVDFGKNVISDLQKAAKEKEIIEKVEAFKKLVATAKEFISEHGDVLSKDKEVAHIINDIMNNETTELMKTGNLLEAIIAYMGTSIDSQGRGIIDWKKDNNELQATAVATTQVLGRKDTTDTGLSLKHQLTTDIKVMLDTMNEAIGISVKLNPAYFRKYEHLTADDMNELLPNYAANETLSSQIMYYLSNYAFLTQMYYPKNDSSYRGKFGWSFDVDGPIKGSAVQWTDSFGDIQNSLATLLFIKGVIGSFFLHSSNVDNIDNFYQELQEQGVPLIIQTSVAQYWTVDLLRAIQKISTDGNAISAFNKWSYGAMEDLQRKAAKLTENFRHLFKEKLFHWAANPPVTPDYAGDRYEEIMQWAGAREDMKKIETELWGKGSSNSKRLMKFFAGKTKLIRYSYNQMMKDIGEK